MKKQIVIIHGGTTFDTYEEYIAYLKNKEVGIDKFKMRKDWKDTLISVLSGDIEVLFPRMPNGTNARYEEWKIWFEKMIPFLNDEVVFIGHSLGGIFLAKYFSESVLGKNNKALILVAAPFDREGQGDSLGDFILSKSLDKVDEQFSKVYLIHSKDDPVVPFKQSGEYKKALVKSELIIFEDRQHFNQEVFPEIVDLIDGL
ncbi:MAG: alpha/beta hydrolase [bacterium]